MAAILSKFSALCESFCFVVYFLELRLILFYNRDIYYYTSIFLIFIPHSVVDIYHEHFITSDFISVDLSIFIYLIWQSAFLFF